MKKVWITYSWKDNEEKDVDFIAQQLGKDVEVKLDRWVLGAGKRLWEQLDNHISNPDESDAWLIYATQNSLGSEPCKEEFAIARQRALDSRGANFPIIALFPASVENSLIPPGITIRLHVSLSDTDWKERIISAAQNRQPSISAPITEPYVLTLHKSVGGDNVIEVRPRAGTWSPFIMAIPANEIEEDKVRIMHGPKSLVPNGGSLNNTLEGVCDQPAGWKFKQAGNEATPTQSYYLFCKKMPSEIIFGQATSEEKYKVTFHQKEAA
jgi:hypothetical protein